MISREQLSARLQGAGYRFQKKNDRNQTWKKRNGSHRVTFSMHALYSEPEVRSILKQVKLTQHEIDEFMAAAVK